MVFKLNNFSLSMFLGVSLTLPMVAAALPFNSDMVDSQMRVGSVMRPSVPGTVPVGGLVGRITTKAEAEKLTNPVKATDASIARGRRLFMTNCSVCHSDIEKKPYVPSVVASKGMPGPDLTADPYPSRTDGSIYGTIHLGGMVLMPPYGWKLSPKEHWDIVNYVRKAQNSKVGK